MPVVELVLTTLVTQAVSHYAQQGFGWFDGRTQRLAEAAAAGDDAAREEVEHVFADKLAQARARSMAGPGDVGADGALSAEEIVADVVFGVPQREEGNLSRLLVKFGEILDGTFRGVHELPTSVAAVPGWFHSANCVAVLDARGRGTRWRAEANLNWSAARPSRPHFAFPEPPMRPAGRRDDRLGVPRVAVLECSGPAEVLEVAARVRPELQTFGAETREWTRRALAEAAGVDPGRVRYMLRLFEDRVELGAPGSDEQEPEVDIVEWMDRPKAGPAVAELANPAAVLGMKADLVRQVLGDIARVDAWLDV